MEVLGHRLNEQMEQGGKSNALECSPCGGFYRAFLARILPCRAVIVVASGRVVVPLINVSPGL